MFRSRIDHISGLIGLHQHLESSNINSLLENPTSIAEDVEAIRDFLKTEIESFASFIIDDSLEGMGTMDIQFAEKVIEFNAQFFGDLLAKSITKFYSKIGFDYLFNVIDNIKNLTSAIDGIEALFKIIIVNGEKHRTEACKLTTKLEEITSIEICDKLSADQMMRATNMIERLKPHARPIVKKMFYLKGMTLKEGEENGVSYPIFSKSGSWFEHTLLQDVFTSQYEEKQNRYKKLLKKEKKDDSTE